MKRNHAEILATDGTSIKSGIGSTGVELQYHTHKEYKKLSTEEKTELHEWRKTNTDKAEKTTSTLKKLDGKMVSFGDHKKMKKVVLEMVAAELTSCSDKEKAKQADQEEELAASTYLLSLVEMAAAAKAASTEAATPHLLSVLKVFSSMLLRSRRIDWCWRCLSLH